MIRQSNLDQGCSYDDIDAGNLLEHLVDVCEYRPMQIAVAVCLETVFETALLHLIGYVLDSLELALDFLVVFGKIGECG